ncbi:MAG: FAD-dependent monooxygenase [Rhodanobacteraceae bacterium]
MNRRTDILIVGGGLVGTSLALALDAAGRDAVLVEAAPPRTATASGDDDRNLVLARASINALTALDVWPLVDQLAGTIRRLEISRAGEFGRVRMSAEDAGVDALGRVVPGSRLAAALQQRVAMCTHVQRLAPAKLEVLRSVSGSDDHDHPPHPGPLPAGERETSAQRVDGEGAGVQSGWQARVRVGNEIHEIDARLVVGADGSDSLVRAQVGIAAQMHDYRQSLIVATVSCGRDLPDVAFERFTDEGPVALLPLPNQRRGLVLTVAADRHDAVMGMDDDAFLALAQRRFGWKLDALSRPGKRFAHRIRRVLADGLTAPRAVIVGNAAQTVHPIGAQGFNLGLRDAMTLAELVARADDPGAPGLLREYAVRRAPDRDGVVAFSHGLIALVCLAQPALAPVRSLALLALDGVPVLRRRIERRGMGFRGRPPATTLDAGP